MASKVNVAYVEKDSPEEHLKVIRSTKIIIADMVDSNLKVKCMVHQSSSQYRGIRSAINYVYNLVRVKMTERIKKQISTFIVGLERTVIAEKQMLGIKKMKEKKPISLEAYELLAKTIFERVEKRDIFHSYQM